MAWDDQKFWLNIRWVDKRGKASNTRLQMQEPLYVDAAADALIVLGYLEAVVEASATTYELTQRFVNDAWAYPGNDCSVAEKAILTMRVLNIPGKKVSFAVPAPAIGIFEEDEGPNADIVDATDPDLQALVGMFTADGECFISDGEEIAEIVDGGFLRGRRSNRRYPEQVG